MYVRNCGVWCAVGDVVSHLRPSICEVIFEPARPKMRKTGVARNVDMDDGGTNGNDR